MARIPLFVLFGGGAGPLNYWQTRYIPSVTGLDGRGLWITPGRDGISITDPQAGGSGKLRPQAAFAIVGTGTTTPNGSEETLSGLVPDGNRTVTLVLQSGAHVTSPSSTTTSSKRPCMARSSQSSTETLRSESPNTDSSVIARNTPLGGASLDAPVPLSPAAQLALRLRWHVEAQSGTAQNP